MNTSEHPIVIYHNDADGFGAAWALSKYLGPHIRLQASSYRPIQPSTIEGSPVYMVDVCFSRDLMLEIAERASSLLVLDHHAKTQKLTDIPGIHYTDQYSACVYTWHYCHPNVPVPKILEYVQDRDLWQWKMFQSKQINTYLNILPQQFGPWDAASNMSIPELLQASVYAHQAMQHYIQTMLPFTSFTQWAGHIVPQVNAGPWFKSELLNILASTPLRPGYQTGDRWQDFVVVPPEEGETPAFALGWHRTDYGDYKCDLRSATNPKTGERCNVATIAEAYGGGGHLGASGFFVDKPIFGIFQRVQD